MLIFIEYSLDNKCHSHREKYDLEIVSLTIYKEGYYLGWISVIFVEKDITQI